MNETKAPSYVAATAAPTNGIGNAVNGLTDSTNEDTAGWMAKRIAELDARLQAQAKQIELMLQQLDIESEMVASLMKRMAAQTAQSESEPERYVRSNISKTSKGYSRDDTVSVRGALSHDELRQELRALYQISDEEARIEIARRESLDEGVTR